MRSRFSPRLPNIGNPHRGHQLVIERAISENDHVIVLIYDAIEVTHVSLETRAQWIKTLYPTVEVILAQDGPTVVGDSPEVMRLHDVYLKRFLFGKDITRFYSSEFYGDHVSRALGAMDCRVDESRELVPISGTAIRDDPFQHRGFLEPIVYRDLIAKVVFLGSSRLTHSDPKAEYGAIAVAMAAKHSREHEIVKANLWLDQVVDAVGEDGSELIDLFRKALASVRDDESTIAFARGLGLGKGVTGYTYHTVPVAIHAWLSHPKDFRQTVTAMIRCGGDADPDELLEGGGKFRRHLTFKTLNDVDAKVVKRFTKAASKLGAG